VSHLASIRNGGEEGVIYINPQAVNPLGEEPAVYGPYEHQKGGDHAFYERTMEDIGPEAALRGLDLIVGSIRNA
jgi:hypothetical protein